jgi:hypothetical protein
MFHDCTDYNNYETGNISNTPFPIPIREYASLTLSFGEFNDIPIKDIPDYQLKRLIENMSYYVAWHGNYELLNALKKEYSYRCENNITITGV